MLLPISVRSTGHTTDNNATIRDINEVNKLENYISVTPEVAQSYGYISRSDCCYPRNFHPERAFNSYELPPQAVLYQRSSQRRALDCDHLYEKLFNGKWMATVVSLASNTIRPPYRFLVADILKNVSWSTEGRLQDIRPRSRYS